MRPGVLVRWCFSEFFSAKRCSRHRREIESCCSVTRIGATTRAGQESRTGPVAAGRPQKKNAQSVACTEKALTPPLNRSGKSSIFFPDLSCAVNQRGFIPGSAVADHSLTSMTLHSSKLAKWVAYDFSARCVGRCASRKLRPSPTDPSLLSPTSAIPCPCSETGSMTIAKGRVSIFTSPRFYVTASMWQKPAGREPAGCLIYVDQVSRRETCSDHPDVLPITEGDLLV